MSYDVRPILSALLRNRTGAVLVALQVAIALAVLVNALYIVVQRAERMSRPTGIDVDNIIVVTSKGFTQRYQPVAAMQEDLAYLRSLPGVIAATVTNSPPLCDGGNNEQLVTQPAAHRTDNYNQIEVDEQGLDALGLHLIAGRNFRHDEITPPLTTTDASRFVPSIIIGRELGERLYPHDNPLGKPVYDSLNQVATIIGIVDPVMGNFPSHDHPGWVYFAPRLAYGFGGPVDYLIRTQPGRRAALTGTIEAHLSKSNPDRVIGSVRPLNFYRDLTYLPDRAMEIYLITVTALLIAITGLGIFALATFNVSTRTKQIGTRRAVGARRRDIVRYFLVENGLITTAGVVAGCALALAAGYWLSLEYSLPRLDLYYLVGGVLVLWGIGQLAAWQPARRAAAVPPSVATRTV
ncbi:MAG TPA: FtsX-like permease family protein [Steroidobacteraceae bacterium]|nr:FtsX-like permease family protein [Steroidobacteraceae bacterium]